MSACAGVPADDLEIFARNQMGLAADHDPWLLLSRGLHLETEEEGGALRGQATDEGPQRGIWRRWAELMAGSIRSPH